MYAELQETGPDTAMTKTRQNTLSQEVTKNEPQPLRRNEEK